MNTALVFPGQGSQAVGMGRSLADNFVVARDVFAEVDEALHQNLAQLMFEGAEDELTATVNAQPALMAVSMAALRVLEAETGFVLARDAAFVAGHSLGEYSALAAAGSLGLADAARLLRIRGKAMQDAVPPGAGAMAAILGIEMDAAQAVADAAAQGDVCAAANDNGGGQVVVSGSRAAVERALTIAKTHGAKRAIMLPVSAPFHCALMRPAAEIMRHALDGIAIRAPAVPLVANVTARPVDDPEVIRRHLVEQVTSTVRWRESMVYLADHGVSRILEIGAGKVLAGLAKRILPGCEAVSIGTFEAVEGLRGVAVAA